ncbi:MAG TPA: (d)CMP kinase [Opitutales bacterium]|nr:(d)CMP kinase [Opitutales bacterium]
MDERDFVIVTIDGGAATGKSSTARELSKRFNLLHVDTGAFYRTVTLALLRADIDPSDPVAIEKALPKLGISTRIVGRQAQMEIDGAIPGEEIRDAKVNESVSLFAAHPAVRTYLLDYQRNQQEIARANGYPGLVMEGRDIGSVIFPDAEFRFFLVADDEERMRRRAGQGQTDSIRKRDKLDTERKTAPLRCPPNAITINTTSFPLDEVVEKISQKLDSKLPRIS